jgi:uncharacterized protein
MKKKYEKLYNDKEFISIIEDMLKNEMVNEMKKYRHHFKVSCYDHCLLVSYYCYRICKKIKLDYKSSARAGMVHDMFLYDWRKRENGRTGHHAFTHPKVALENAEKNFELNDKERDIILHHMWPVTLKPPKTAEGFIITLVDKYCAITDIRS